MIAGPMRAQCLPVGRPADGDSPGQHEVAVPPEREEQQERQTRQGPEISDKVPRPVGQGQLVAAL